MRRPLTYAIRNEGKNLGVVRGLEPLVSGVAGQLEDPARRTSLAALSKGLDALELPAKQAQIEAILQALDGAPGPDAAPPPAAAHAETPRAEPREPPAPPPKAKAPRRKKAAQLSLEEPAPKPEKKPKKKSSRGLAPLDAGGSRLAQLPLTAIEGVGPATARHLLSAGVETVLDALFWLPRAYEDRSSITKIATLVPGELAVVRARVLHAAIGRGGKGRPVFEVAVSDGTGTLSLRWFRFHTESMKRRFVRDKELTITGTVTAWGAMRQMVHPEIDSTGAEHESLGIAPVYSEVPGLHMKQLRKVLQDIARRFAKRIEDPLPDSMRRARGLSDLATSVEKAHLPEILEPGEDPDAAVRHRLVYDELFFFQLMLARRKRSWAAVTGLEHLPKRPFQAIAEQMLPFRLTKAQERALVGITKDLAAPRPMNRLLQGDVGSGKTAVAMIAAAVVAEAGRQTAILAPTEILAEQHAVTGGRFLSRVGLKHALLTGSTKQKDRRELLAALANKEIDVLIGTHALLEDPVIFADLGLAIVDEQHRFGVEQRAALRKKSKGAPPDVLVMTATPIPRTLALTVYGDLEVSVLDERPPGRTPITTRVLKERDRGEAFRVIDQALSAGRQAYVVFPLVEASETLDLGAATDAVTDVAHRFPKHKVGLLHGRMRPEDKAAVMDAFRGGEVSVLVSTTVIEVGVDVPNATIMVVENAERFGLSQIHQLRGRVGRGAHAGTCLLVVGGGGEEAWNKLAVLERTDDGFQVAEADLMIRGPGELLGTRQSGVGGLAIADLARDREALDAAREDAFRLIAEDPELSRDEHARIKAEADRRHRHEHALVDVG
ncbi:MAG: ATP-dependent DNA helicase RecG [Myxococcota bacterium]